MSWASRAAQLMLLKVLEDSQPKLTNSPLTISRSKIRRGPKLEGCAFANFRNSSGTEEEPSQKREKKFEGFQT